jgi:hypothetical protein
MAEDLLGRARALFGDTPNPVSERAGNVNNFRSEVERRFGPVQRMMGQSVPGQQDLGIPNYDEYTQRRAAQQSLLDRARNLFGGEPSASRAGSVPPAGTPPAAPMPPRDGGSVPEVRPAAAAPGQAMRPLMPRGAGLIAAYPFLQQLFGAIQEQRNDPPMYDAQGRYLGHMSEMYGEVAREGAAGPGSVAGESERSAGQVGGESGSPLSERGRDTGQRQGPARPQGRAAQPQIDPQFAQLLQTILSPPQAPQAAPAPPAPASRPGPGLILDPMMGGGNA